GPDQPGEDDAGEERGDPAAGGTSLHRQRRDEEGGDARERGALREVAGEERKHVRRPEEQRGRPQARCPRQARQARREVKQGGRRAEEHAWSEPRRAGQTEESEHRGMAGKVLGGKSGDDQHVRRLEEFRERGRRVAEMASRERLRLEQVDELVLGARPRAPGAAGEGVHAEERAEQQQQRRAERVGAPRPCHAPYSPHSDLHPSTSRFLASPRNGPLQSTACTSPRKLISRRSSSRSSCRAWTRQRPWPPACARRWLHAARPESRPRCWSPTTARATALRSWRATPARAWSTRRRRDTARRSRARSRPR